MIKNHFSSLRYSGIKNRRNNNQIDKRKGTHQITTIQTDCFGVRVPNYNQIQLFGGFKDEQ